MPRDFQGEARQESQQQQMQLAWRQQRIAAIHACVSAFDVLRHFGIDLKQHGDHREEQISCPFHGKDTKPSARIYPAGTTSHSSVWCFVCQEQWDVIALWRKFADVPFSQALSEIERHFGITTSSAPRLADRQAEKHAEEVAEIESIFEVAETRLRGAKDSFDMVGFFTIGSVLDRLRCDFDCGKMPHPTVRATLAKVLDKIGIRCRAA